MLSPLVIIGDWSICRGPGWLFGLMGAPFGPILPCMAPCCTGPDAPRGGAEAEATQPSCCCMPGRGPPGAMSPRGANTHRDKKWEMPQDRVQWVFSVTRMQYQGKSNQSIAEGCLKTANMWEWRQEKNVLPVWLTDCFLSQEVSHCAIGWYIIG